MMKENKPTTWLTVGGCPRSGTTALGALLSAHPDIALFHEYDQAHFFRTIDALFNEERRLMAWPDTTQFDLLPRQERHAVSFARAIFREVSGKDARIIGTKFPGAHMWPQPSIPDGMFWKQIHISREPFSVIASYAKKMVKEKYPGGRARIIETAIAHWISAWNYAVALREDRDFLHVVYEDISDDPEGESYRVASFLGVEGDLDFSSFKSTNKTPEHYIEQLKADGFGEWIGLMGIFDQCRDWGEFVRSGKKLGFPLSGGQSIDLTSEQSGNLWKYTNSGFYPPERDGSWIKGERASITFTPDFDADACALCLTVPWVYEPNGEAPRVEVLVDGIPRGFAEFQMGKRNGTPRRFGLVLGGRGDCPLWLRAGVAATIEFVAKNPRNPKKLSGSQDDRELTIMLREIHISPV